MRKYLFHIVFGLLTLINLGCVEEIDLLTETEFQDALVIEATITNELKQQVIKLSRSYPLEVSGPSPESNATVKVIDGAGNAISFSESESGIYLSNQPFAAQPNIDYRLEITTSNGKSYGSTTMQLTPQTPIGDLYVERGFNENEDEGVSIFVDTYDLSGNTNYYRFEYEETYKIIAPDYSPLELNIQNDDFPYANMNGEFLSQFLDANGLNLDELTDFFVTLDFRESQEQICYNSVKSNHILVTSTTDLIEDQLSQYRVRFINRNNYIISHRYSILVRQYIQSKEAHTFYKTLRDFSSEGNLFSQIQTGFLEGNVFSLSNNEELVVGFFEVSYVDEKRVYFNYADLFPGESLPPYYINCDDYYRPILLREDFVHNIIDSPLINALKGGWIFFQEVEDNSFSPFSYAPYELVLEPCGDCTVLGQNVVPDFWED